MNQVYQITMPKGYYELKPEHIKFLADLDIGKRADWKMPPWGTLPPNKHRWFQLKAWWALMGVKSPGMAATVQSMVEAPIDHGWDAECRQRGWPVWHPTHYRELEKKFLPKPKPSVKLIMARCPQMALLHALGGNVSEPYWWAGLSITEHAEPNISKECSAGYPSFSVAELEYRQNRIKNEDIKPALCKRLNASNPNLPW